ncbi:MAG TPA: MltA domain-containing protein [Burkholderiales bacterium]|nr:MltA domain-containing protein [Burkholderiales bacterium]
MTHIFSRALPALIVLAALVVASCTPLPPKPEPVPTPPPVKPPSGPETALYQEVAFDTLPGWQQAALVPSLRAFLVGCGRPPAPLLVACELAALVPPGDEAATRQFFESQFTAYALRSSNAGDTGLLTGYYEPIIDGARQRDGENRFPVYGVPDDLIVVELASVNPDVRNMRLRGRLEGRRLVPYYSRAEIEARNVPAQVIAWTKDPVDLFFLQIQGSGQIRLADGARLRIGYADQNGHPFRSLGRYLVDRGEMTLDQASMQNIKAWAAANPHKLREALNANPSYVFFRELKELREDEGPIGALGVPLTAGYSMAVDRRFMPLGAPVYLATTYPLSEERLERLMAAQDVGGAIRGVVRGDFYWGSGVDAGAQAGRMRNPARMWLLWPRGLPLPRDGAATCC